MGVFFFILDFFERVGLFGVFSGGADRRGR